MTKDEYTRFVAELRGGAKVMPHAFEEPKYFEGCLPIEVMAERGEETLAFGPMKPVGLRDPRTGQQPHAVVQLRMEDRAGTAWNLVGFQTRLTWPEQKRIFGLIPGLANAEWVRMGQIHRNTFLDSPRLLAPGLLAQERAPALLRRADHRRGGLRGIDRLRLPHRAGAARAPERDAPSPRRPPAPPWARSTATSPAKRTPRATATSPPTWCSRCSRPLEGRHKKAEKRVLYSQRAVRDFDGWAPSRAAPGFPHAPVAPNAVGPEAFVRGRAGGVLMPCLESPPMRSFPVLLALLVLAGLQRTEDGQR